MPTKWAIFVNLTYTVKTEWTNFLYSCVFHSLPQDPEQTSPPPGAHVAELRCLAGWAQGHYFTDKSCCEESWTWGTVSTFHWEVLLRRGFIANPSLCTSEMGSSEVCAQPHVSPSILPLTHTCRLGFLAFPDTVDLPGAHCPVSDSDHSSWMQSWC